MREIKFRVFDRCHKRMHVVGEDTHDSLTCYDGEIQYYNLQNGEGSGEHGDYTLMQFTGLKDKNGTEIYEGDIVQVDSFITGDIGFECIYNEDTASFLFAPFVIGDKDAPLIGVEEFAQHWDEISNCAVIGNIYENPELLEEIPC